MTNSFLTTNVVENSFVAVVVVVAVVVAVVVVVVVVAQGRCHDDTSCHNTYG